MQTYDELKKEMCEFLNITDEEFDYLLHQEPNHPFPKEITPNTLKAFYTTQWDDPIWIIHSIRKEIFDENLGKDIKIIKQLKKFGEIESILEYGSGNGLTSIRLAQEGYKIDFCDFDHKMLKWTENQIKKYYSEVKAFTPDNILWLPNFYDAIVCLHVLEHVQDGPQLLDNLMKSIKPGGLLVLEYPNKWYEPDTNPDHIGDEKFKDQIANILTKNGFIQKNIFPQVWLKMKKTDMYDDYLTIKVKQTGEFNITTNIPQTRLLEMIGIVEMAQDVLKSKLKTGAGK